MGMYKCSVCQGESERHLLKRLKGIWFCKKCYKDNRKNHRKETIEITGIKEELKELEKKRQEETYKKDGGRKEYFRKRYEEKVSHPVRKYSKSSFPPKIKNSSLKVTIPKTNCCYMTLREKQDFFRILVRRGISSEEADERIKALVSYESQLRKEMRLKHKSDEEISKQVESKKMEMLEELWGH
jgi:hypothetical protein